MSVEAEVKEGVYDRLTLSRLAAEADMVIQRVYGDRQPPANLKLEIVKVLRRAESEAIEAVSAAIRVYKEP